MFNIVSRRYWYFLLSALVVVPGIVFMVLFGLPRSIDFTGGSLYDVQFSDPSKVTENAIREVYRHQGQLHNRADFDEIAIVRASDATDANVHYQIRSKFIDEDTKNGITAEFKERFGGEVTDLRFEAVGASVGELVTRNAAVAVLLSSLGILIYLTIVFRNVAHPIRYGVCAIAAMLHDVLLVLGLAAIMGKLFGWEVDALFLTALLTVIGFSVHDSIVVFDRIRENVGRLRGLPYEQIVNHSIVQTLDRSINTQLTAMFALISILVYSEGQLQRFAFWLLIGILSGTYSSIFNAAPLLVVWENKEWRNWFGKNKREAAATA